MRTRVYFDGDIFERAGFRFRVEFPYDDCSEAPWERCDGHGPVSDWVSAETWRGHTTKSPGQRILCRDRGKVMYYDMKEAMRLAKKDGWGVDSETLYQMERKLGRKPTEGEIRAAAVEKDFDYLRRWCDEQWCYVGVVVEMLEGDEDDDGDGTVIKTDSLWGIESDAYEYLAEVAHEMADQMAYEYTRENKERRTWAERDVMTV